MNPKLFAFLNAKTVNFDSCGGGDLSVSDFNAACSGADPIGLELLKRKWGGSSTREGFGILIEEILELSRYWRIKDNRKGKLDGLFKLALYETTSLPPCPYCRGRGERVVKGKLDSCSPCRGTGHYRIKDTEKARMIGVKKQSWKVWESRYSEVLRLFDEHMYKAMRSIDERMKDDIR